MSDVPRRASFDDLRVGQEVIWTSGGKFDGGGTVIGFGDDRVDVSFDGHTESVHRNAAWVILRDAPAAPVTVRREDYDALVAGLKGGHRDNQPLYAAARALIDNADTGDNP